MSTQATLSKNITTIALKGGMFTLTTIQLLAYDLAALSEELDDKINQAPNFFHYAPIILDLSRFNTQDNDFDLAGVIGTLRTKKLIPIGLRGANKMIKDAAMNAGLAIFPEEKVMAQKKKSSSSVEDHKSTETTQTIPVARTETVHTASRVITQPVRSGQQIYAQGGDLIVLASVGHGAELLADGNIHVYGPMRGRALAGVMGDKEAMIFCRSLEAELVSIAGQYRLSEDLKETCWKQPACISLQDDRLQIRAV